MRALLVYIWEHETVRRARRTAGQVAVPILLLALADYGYDGRVNLADYLFGGEGFIVAFATAMALWMNRPGTYPE